MWLGCATEICIPRPNCQYGGTHRYSIHAITIGKQAVLKKFITFQTAAVI
jgi:hypothetical protein